jgi:hypothetical protein
MLSFVSFVSFVVKRQLHSLSLSGARTADCPANGTKGRGAVDRLHRNASAQPDAPTRFAHLACERPDTRHRSARPLPLSTVRRHGPAECARAHRGADASHRKSEDFKERHMQLHRQSIRFVLPAFAIALFAGAAALRVERACGPRGTDPHARP